MAIGIGDNRANQQNQPAGAAPAITQQRVGTGFTNIQKYLRPQSGNELGSKINTGVGQKVTQTQQGLSNVQSSVGNQLTAAAQPANVSSYDTQLNKALQNPNTITDDDVKTFQTGLSGTYSGPSEQAVQSSYQPVLGQAQKVTQLGQQTRTDEGRKSLLQQFAAKNPLAYTAGKQTLDSLLLGKKGQQDMAKTLGMGYPLEGQVAAAQQRQLGQIGTIRSDLSKTAGTLKDRLTTEQKKIADAASQRAQAARQAGLSSIQDYKNLQDYLNSGNFHGFGPDSGLPTALVNKDTAKLLKNFGPSDVNYYKNALRIDEGDYSNPNAYLNDQDLASSSALAKLAGNPDMALRKVASRDASASFDLDPLVQQASQAKAAKAEEIKNKLRSLYGAVGKDYTFSDKLNTADVDVLNARDAVRQREAWKAGNTYSPSAQTLSERAAIREQLKNLFNE